MPKLTPRKRLQREAPLDVGEEDHDARRNVLLISIGRELRTTLATAEALRPNLRAISATGRSSSCLQARVKRCSVASMDLGCVADSGDRRCACARARAS